MATDDDKARDEVLKRLLKTPPVPRDKKNKEGGESIREADRNDCGEPRKP